MDTMTLYLTKKLADKMGLSLAPSPQAPSPQAAPPQAAEDALYSWRADYIKKYSFNAVVFMNDASRFTVVIAKAGKAKLARLRELFMQALRETLLALSVNPEVAEKYISELGDITYSKSSDRKKIVQLTKNTETVLLCLRDFVGIEELPVVVNKRIYHAADAGGFIVPKEKMLELLGKYGLPVRKCRAFDVRARLDLDGPDAVRRLRVPADITFEQFHGLLQIAFGWHNCHLYSFGMYKEWSEDYYAQAQVKLVMDVDEYGDAPGLTPMEGVKLSDYVPEYKKILYTYDFGDNWWHYIEVEDVIEGCEEKLPILLSGEGDAPPEDSGGVGGFAEFLQIIADPTHEDHEEMIGWAKMQYWERFDFKETAKRISCTL
jgi:hypothetical protein